MPQIAGGPVLDTVDNFGIEYKRMQVFWPLVDALWGGTRTMRLAGETLLKREPKEKIQKYRVRISRSYLFGAYRTTVEEFSRAPFAHPVSLKESEKLDEMLQPLERNADLRGRSITRFGEQVLREAIHRGVSHILPEFPAQGIRRTAGQERRAGVRPYFIHVSSMDLYGWRLRELPDGTDRVTGFRVHERSIVPHGRYMEQELDTIRVYNLAYEDEVDLRDVMLRESFGESSFFLGESPADILGMPGTVEVWRKQKDAASYALEMVRPYTFIGMPLVTIYTNRTGLLTGTPAMEDLAQKNVEHWQSSSDQSNLLRIARVPILLRLGVKQEEIDKGYEIGPTTGIDFKDPKANMKFVEHSGKAIEAGRRHDLDIEEQMEVLKLRPRMKQTGAPKATIAAIGEARGMSSLETWALDTAMGLRMAYEKAEQWRTGNPTAELPKEFDVQLVARNLVLDPRAEKDIQNLIKMREKRELSRRTFLFEVRKRGGLSEDLNIDEEIDRITEEGDEASAKLFGPAPGKNADEEEKEEEEEETSEEDEE